MRQLWLPRRGRTELEKGAEEAESKIKSPAREVVLTRAEENSPVMEISPRAYFSPPYQRRGENPTSAKSQANISPTRIEPPRLSEKEVIRTAVQTELARERPSSLDDRDEKSTRNETSSGSDLRCMDLNTRSEPSRAVFLFVEITDLLKKPKEK